MFSSRLGCAEAREPIARLVALDSFLLLLASALLGAYVLDFFGLPIGDVQVGGGIIVCALAWSLLRGSDGPDALSRSSAEQVAATDWRPRVFYPLTMPATVGPGSISVALTLGAHHSSSIRGSLLDAVATTLGILIAAVAVYVCYRYATTIFRKLGTTGAAVVSRLSAFLLLCIGVHIAWAGAQALLTSAFPNMVR
jgi:multiple antibiotic resistance protein